MSKIVFAEIFPILEETLPPLYLYTLEGEDREVARVKGKFFYHLRKSLKGHWVWTQEGILGDNPLEREEGEKFLENLWQKFPDTFGALQGFSPKENWAPSTLERAEFVSRGLLGELEEELQKILRKALPDLGQAQVERIYESRGWVVQEKPALSLSVPSRLISREGLEKLLQKNPDQWVDKAVVVKGATLRGTITALVGPLSEHRKRLLALSQDEAIRQILEKAPDDNPVIRVAAGKGRYEYPSSALHISIGPQDYRLFGISGREVGKVLGMEPEVRVSLIRDISKLLKEKGLVGDSYNSLRYPDLFSSADDLPFEPYLLFGLDQSCRHSPYIFLKNLEAYGMYRSSGETSLPIGVINGSRKPAVQNFLQDFQKTLERLEISPLMGKPETLSRSNQRTIEEALERVMKKKTRPRILLLFLPRMYRPKEEESFFQELKFLNISKDMPIQIIYESFFRREYGLATLVMGALGKTGHLPFVLAKPLEGFDWVVGLDLSGSEKDGRVCAQARYYKNRGEFLDYMLASAPWKGGTLPENLLEKIFPEVDFQNKKVIIHCKGALTPGFADSLKRWGAEIGSSFNLVEILTWSVPRLYSLEKGEVNPPPEGSVLKISDREAFLVSYSPISSGTPKPLYIRTDGEMDLSEALKSILSFTLLHYGLSHPPRLPVTLYNCDQITHLFQSGVLKEGTGTVPIWL